MTFSVDDLVNSLNSSHIGQEAMDLAALQAQLTQSLMHVSSRAQPSTSSWSFEQRAGPSRRGSVSSSLSSSNDHRQSISESSPYSYTDEMEEDERMVEELLMPTSTNHSSSQIMSTSPQSSDSSSSSLFTTTDPFYLSALQQAASNNSSSSSSVFAQNAILNPSSPFAMHQQYQHNNFNSYASAF